MSVTRALDTQLMDFLFFFRAFLFSFFHVFSFFSIPALDPLRSVPVSHWPSVSTTTGIPSQVPPSPSVETSSSESRNQSQQKQQQRQSMSRGSLFAPPVPAHRHQVTRSSSDVKSAAEGPAQLASDYDSSSRDDPIGIPIVSTDDLRRRRLEEEATR